MTGAQVFISTAKRLNISTSFSRRQRFRFITWLGLWRGRRKWGDFHRLDQAEPKGEPMADVLIGKNCSSQVAHHLMHIDQDMLGPVGVKSHRLHVWIDLAPLLPPVSADLLMSMDETAFERLRPSHVRSHEGESSVNVPCVERRVGCAEQFDLWCGVIWHKRCDEATQ